MTATFITCYNTLQLHTVTNRDSLRAWNIWFREFFKKKQKTNSITLLHKQTKKCTASQCCTHKKKPNKAEV